MTDFTDFDSYIGVDRTDAAQNNESFEKLKLAKNGYASAVTKEASSATAMALDVMGPPVVATQSMLDKLHEHLDKLTKKHDKLMTCLDLMASFTNKENELATIHDMDKKYTAIFQSARSEIIKSLGKIQEIFDETSSTAAPAAGVAHDHVHTSKPSELLKPFTLTSQHKPVELNEWIDRFRAFCRNSNIMKKDPIDQQEHMRIFVEAKIFQVIKQSFNDTTPVDSNDPEGKSCLDFLKDYFFRLHPLPLRRWQYFKFKKTKGQSYSEFQAELNNLDLAAQIQDMTYEDTRIFRIITGYDDQDLNDKIMAIPKDKWSYDEVDRVAKGHEAGQAFKQAHQSNKTSFQKNKKGKWKGPNNNNSNNNGNNNTSQSQSGKNRKQEMLDKGLCTRCGIKKKHGDCKAKNDVCNGCGQKGHWKPACYNSSSSRSRANSRSGSRQNSRQTSPEPSGDQQTKIIRLAKKTTRKDETPRQRMIFEPFVGQNFEIDVVPDSGTTKTIFAYDVIRKHGVGIDPNEDEDRLFNASDKPMNVAGTVQIKTTFQGKTKVVHGLVSKDLKDEVLVSWKDCEDLGSMFITRSIRMNQMKKLEELKDKYQDILSDSLSKTPMKGAPMKIHLKKNVKMYPRKITTAANIPIHHQAEADRVVNQLIDSGVCERAPENEPSQWLHRAFFVEKPDGKSLRLVSDMSAINEYIERPVHPFTAGQDLIKNVKPSSMVFAKLDATHGYYQIPLDEESKKLTTFLLPMGRFRFCRAPMGMASSSDEWCRRSDQAVHGLPDVLKLVDDILVQGTDYEDLFEKLEAVLQRCREHNITLSLKKLEVGEKVNFAGFQVSAEGVQPLPERTEAIRSFPRPENIQDIRSFMGLAQQLGHFLPDLAHVSEPLRQLLKKNQAWLWLPDHEEAFQEAKKMLTGDLLVSHFGPNLATELVVDASRKGLGFALIQRNLDGSLRLIQCGSKSLSDAETRYAVCELEGLAILYAIKKCRHFLLGHHGFTVVTDHKPLKGVFAKDLSQIENVRLRRYREKLTGYNFNLDWREGKTHFIADALSRAPIFGSDDMPEDEVDICRKMKLDSSRSLEPMMEEAKVDSEYQMLIKAILEIKDAKSLPKIHPGRQYSNNWHELSVNDLGLIELGDSRLVVPRGLRKELVKKLHAAHCGITKTQMHARSLYYWPRMNLEIKTEVENCEVCRYYLPSNSKQPFALAPPGRSPMSQVGADLFKLNNKDYLVMVDRYSGFAFCNILKSLVTSAVTKQILQWFLEFGFPERIRTDGGPQFRSEFKAFCDEFNIKHEVSSPHYHESNGLAEAAVKQMKHLLDKKNQKWDDFQMALLEWRNTPNATGYSPSQLFFGRRQKGILPMLPSMTDLDVDSAIKGAAARMDLAESKNSNSILKHELGKGQRVAVQNESSKRWDSMGEIVETRESGESYVISLDNGKQLTRNRSFLRPITREFTRKDPVLEVADSAPPRRSTRLQNKRDSQKSLRIGEGSTKYFNVEDPANQFISL